MFLPIFFTLLVLLQISIGALVSGLDAGQIYQTWPLMDYNYFPDDSNIKDVFYIKTNIKYYVIYNILDIKICLI